MHLTYFTLAQLSHILEQNWKNKSVLQCFSQEKDELVLEVWQGLFLVIHCQSQFPYLFVTSRYPKSHANSVVLWEEIQNLTIQKVTVIQNDRSILIQLEKEYVILVKMHGNQSNVLLYHENKVKYVFRQNLITDFTLDYATLSKDLPISPDALYTHLNAKSYSCYVSAIKQILPVFSKNMMLYLAESVQDKGNKEEVFEKTKMMLEILQNPVQYYVIEDEKQVFFSFFESWKHEQKVIFQDTDLLKSLQMFFNAYFQKTKLYTHKEFVLKHFEKEKKMLSAKIKELEQLVSQKNNPFQEKADVLMANLHQIPKEANNIELYNFYTDTKIHIPLDSKLTPQQNAEKYYKKAKRLETLKNEAKNEIPVFKQKLELALHHLDTLASIQDLKTWNKYAFIWKDILQEKVKSNELSLFRKFEIHGFVVLVSKDAENADLLTLKYAHKNDIWLHAKDVQGAHVVIKRAGNKHIPQIVIETAASLAAYYSKAKGEQLAKVTVTEKKFVIKPKGYDFGKVKVLKEEIVLAEPKLP
jgi:predicted ribosome quality control (RQC) complex YloA/Tae2 family protein